jgi:hypothetical protein
LADPRQIAAKDRLNHIKRRQWWRPVAPVILEEEVNDWFEEADKSPFMLRTFALRPEKVELVPAISHLDRSARIQTLSREEAPVLYGLLQAFHAKTGVPILCNTSLNDKGEPIINTLQEAMLFAKRRGISVIYVDGVRHTCVPDTIPDSTPLAERPFAHLFQSDPSEIAEICHVSNPHGLSRATLALHQLVPAFKLLDVTNRSAADKLARHASRLEKNRVIYWSFIN